MTTVINTNPNVTGVMYSAMGVPFSTNKPPKNCATVSTTIPRGAIIETIALSRLEISVFIVDNNIEIGLTNIIMIAQNINSFHDIILSNTFKVNEDVINIKTVETIIEDAFSIK